MAGITGQGTTFNLPNYTGELFAITPSDTPLLSAIGGLTGGREVLGATEFEWGFYDLRAAGQNTRVEGANAPTPEERVRSNASNVLQIHQEAVEVSYTRQGANRTLSGINVAGLSPAVLDEMSWQELAMMAQIARDVEYSFLRGTYQKPADNTTARKTRGLNAAIATNVTPLGGVGTPLTEDALLDTMQLAWTNGGLQEDDTRTVIVGPARKRDLTKIFVTDKNYREESRNIAGVSVQAIETDFGRVNIMLNRHQEAGTLTIASLEDLAPRFLNIPGKGHFFQEPLAKVGAAERTQFYGEIGLEYGNERKHAKITGITDA
jgi:hypothetical protein